MQLDQPATKTTLRVGNRTCSCVHLENMSETTQADKILGKNPHVLCQSFVSFMSIFVIYARSLTGCPTGPCALQ